MTLSVAKRREAEKERLRLSKQRAEDALMQWVEIAQERASSMTELQWRRSMKSRANNQNARAKKRGAVGLLTAEDLTEVRKAARDLCATCGCETRGAFHFDHIVSMSAGGDNVAANVQLLCIPCNLRKSDKDARNTSTVRREAPCNA